MVLEVLLSAQTKKMDLQLGSPQSAVGEVHPHPELLEIQFVLQIDEAEGFFVLRIAPQKDPCLAQSDQVPFPEK